MCGVHGVHGGDEKCIAECGLEFLKGREITQKICRHSWGDNI
jgi:hypothetical protein